MVSRILEPKRLAAILIALPLLWLFGHLDLVQTIGLSNLHLPLQDDPVRQLLIYEAAVLASALVVGYILALCARAVGHDAIRTLLSISQAQLYGLLASAILWVAVTGLNWSVYRQNEVAAALWYIITGAADGLFGVVWLVLAVRAAASVEPFRSAGILFGAAVATFLSALGAMVVLFIILNNIGAQPSLGLFGLIFLLILGIFAIPPALAVNGSAALWAGVLRLADERSGRGHPGGGEAGS
jgi:hypothetical protein